MFSALMEKIGLFIITKLADPNKAFLKLGEYLESNRPVDSIQKVSEYLSKTGVKKDLLPQAEETDLVDEFKSNFKKYLFYGFILISAGSLIYCHWDSITSYSDTFFDRKGKGPEFPKPEFKEPGTSTQPPLTEGIQSTDGSSLVFQSLQYSGNRDSIQNTSTTFNQFYDRITD
jgi:hypothetical protein